MLYTAPRSSVDLDFADPLTESADLHYYISDDEKRRMFPVDPDIGRTHFTSSVHTARGFTSMMQLQSRMQGAVS